MADRTERDRTVRERTEIGQSTGNAPQLDVQRRNLNAIPYGSNDPVNKANALQKALGIGLDFAVEQGQEKIRNEFLLGKQAAINEDELDEDEKKTLAWMKGYTSVTAQAGFITFQKELEKEIAGMDLSELSAEEFQDFVAGRLKENYNFNPEDSLDRYTMELLQPALEKLEQGAGEVYREYQTRRIEGELDAAMTVSVNAELERTGTVDLENLNKQVFSVYNPGDANAEVVDLITGLAIREGRPDLIEELMETQHWENGAAAPGGIRDFDEELQNALVYSRSQKEINERNAEKADLETKEKITDAVGQQVIGLMADPTGAQVGKAQDIINQAVAEGGMDPDDARVWLNWVAGYSKADLDGVQTDPLVYRELTLKLARGEDISGDLVDPDKLEGLSSDDIAGLMSKNRATQSELRSNPLFGSHLKIVEARFHVSNQILNNSQYGAAAAEEQARAISQFIERYMALPADKKKDPQALKQLAEIDEPTDYVQLATDLQRDLTIDDAVKRIESGVADDSTYEVLKRDIEASGMSSKEYLSKAFPSNDAAYKRAADALGIK